MQVKDQRSKIISGDLDHDLDHDLDQIRSFCEIKITIFYSSVPVVILDLLGLERVVDLSFFISSFFIAAKKYGS